MAFEGDEDSDLEIIPNPPTSNVTLDLSEIPDDPVPSASSQNGNHPGYASSSTTPKCGLKRKIKIESVTPTEPPTKKQRTDQCDGSKRVKVEMPALSPSIEGQSRRSWKTGSNWYHFWSVKGGLNYSGYCMNSECVAVGEPITFHKGYGLVEPIKDVQNGILKCRGCSKIFELKSIDLYKADADMESMLFNQSTIKKERFTTEGKSILRLGHQHYYKHFVSSSMEGRKIDEMSNHINKEMYHSHYKMLKFEVRKVRRKRKARSKKH